MKIQYVVELDDLVAFEQFSLDTSTDLQNRRLIFLLSFNLGFASLALLFWHFTHSMFYVTYYAVAAMFITGWYWRSSTKANPKRVAKLFPPKESSGVFCQHELEILPDRLVERNLIGEEKIRLQGINRIERTATHSFVFTGPFHAYIIPHEKIAAGDINSFMTALNQQWETQRDTDGRQHRENAEPETSR